MVNEGKGGCPTAAAEFETMLTRHPRADLLVLALPVLPIGPPNINKAALVASKSIVNEREAKLRELGEGNRRRLREPHQRRRPSRQRRECGHRHPFTKTPDPRALTAAAGSP